MLNIPASFFGIVLGLAGLGNAWRAAAAVWPVPALVGEALHLAAALVWVVLVAAYIAKWVRSAAAAKSELQHPVQCCFVGLIGVTGMLVATGIRPHAEEVGLVLYIVCVIYTVAFAVWRTGGLWQGGRDPGFTTAVLYLPTVAGSFVTAAVGAAFGFDVWAKMAFGAGLFSWLAIESVLIGRLYTSPALAEALRPTLGIQLAPPAVGGVAYLAVTRGPPDVFAYALLGYAVLQALVLLRLLPWIRKQPFAASYWAFSFGASALATVPFRLMARGADAPAVTILAPIIFVVGNVAIGLLVVGTLVLLGRGRLLPPAKLTVVPSGPKVAGGAS